MARRINTRFAAILGGCALGIVGVVYLADKLLIKSHPEQFTAAAKQAQLARNWTEAADDWSKAIAASPRDPSYWTQYGDALYVVGLNDPALAAKHRDLDAWQQALEIQPGYVPAVKSLVSYWRQRAETAPTVEAFTNAREFAKKFLDMAPGDPDRQAIQSFQYTITIKGWLAGLDSDQASIDETENQMREMARRDPTNTEMPFYLALIDAHRAKLLSDSTQDPKQSDAATALFAKAQTEMASALKTQDKNPISHYHFAELYSSLADEDHSDPDNQSRYMALANQEMDKAVSLLSGKEPEFLEISLRAARLALVSNDSAKAESIVRSLLKTQRDAMTVVNATALIEDIPNLRPQAIEALQSDLNNNSARTAAISARRYEELGALTDLQIKELGAAELAARSTAETQANLNVNQSPDSASAGAISRLEAQISANLKLMEDANRDPLRLVHAQAMFASTEQDNIQTIQVIQRGMSADPRVAADPGLNWMLALAYRGAGEHDQAEVYLKRSVDSNPAFLEAREMLVDEYELSPDPSEAARLEMSQQLNYLRRVAANDPNVIRLQMMKLDPVNDADQLKALYARLPEKNYSQLVNKAQVADKKLHDSEEVARLMTAASDALDPADPKYDSTLVHLAQVEHDDKHDAQAIAAIQKGLQFHPNDPALQVVLKVLQGAPKEEIEAFQQQHLDPFKRDLELAAASQQADNLSGAEMHLKAAEQLASTADDKNRVCDDLFRLYLQMREFDKAGPYLKLLGKANADEAHGLIYEFELAQARGDVDHQMEIGNQLTTELPEFAKSYYYLGQAYQAKGQWVQAVENYNTAMQKKGVGEDQALMLKAEIDCYYHLNQPDQARVAIEQARRDFPDRPDFRLLQIEYELKYGDPQVAAQDLADLIQLNPNVPEIYLELAAAKVQIAQEKLKIPDNDAASAALSSARDLLRDALQKFPDDKRIYGSLADILRIGGDRDGAEKVILSLDARPAWKDALGTPQPAWGQIPAAQLMLASLYDKTSQPEKAEAAYATAMTRAATDAKAEIQIELLYARMLTDHKNYEQALKVLASANPDYPSIRRQRVNVLIASGHIGDAETEIKNVLDEHPSDADKLQATWARLALDSGKAADAAEHADRSLAANPQNVMALVVRGQLHAIQSPPDTDGAMKDYMAALQVSPNDVGVLSAIADIYLYKFDAEHAAITLETAVRIQPDNVPLRLHLVHVYADLAPARFERALQVIHDGENLPGGDHVAALANAEAAVNKKMGKPDLALQTIVAALGRIPGDLTLIQSYFQLLLDNSQYDNAVKGATTIIQQDTHKQLWWAWNTRGQAKSALGDKQGALTDLKQAFEEADALHDNADSVNVVQTISRAVSPDTAIDLVRSRQGSNPQWDICLILLYHDAAQDDQAVQILDPLVAASAGLPTKERISRLELGGMIYATAAPRPMADKAYATYKELLKIDPNNVQALNNLASLCADDFTPPRVEEGIRDISQARQILASRGTDDPMLEDTFGWLLILGGQTAQGIDVVKKAVEPAAFPEGCYHLGEGYLRMNQPSLAQQEVTAALNAIAIAQQKNQPVSASIRGKVADLSNRVLAALQLR